MALAITITKLDTGLDSLSALGTIAFSGSYTAGGDTFDLTKATLPKGGTLPALKLPLQVYIQSQASGGGSGFLYGYRPGTTLANGKVQVFGQQPTSVTAGVIALSELAAGAYPAGITGDTVVFDAIFNKLL